MKGRPVKSIVEFRPRVGLASDVAGDGPTSVRVSTGRFYDFHQTHRQNLATAPPYSPRLTVEDVDFENPWANYPGGDPFPLRYGSAVGPDAPWPLFGLVNVVEYDTPNMLVDRWNLTLIEERTGKE